jgi:hypothetical protein
VAVQRKKAAVGKNAPDKGLSEYLRLASRFKL